jgi:phytanoyl-CoA hydroxylase
VPKQKAINKLGHAMHVLDPAFRAYSNSVPHMNVINSLGLTQPLLAQSMYIFKQPGIGGKVRAHQDNTFLYTTPTSCIGLWVALEDATKDNGFVLRLLAPSTLLLRQNESALPGARFYLSRTSHCYCVLLCSAVACGRRPDRTSLAR